MLDAIASGTAKPSSVRAFVSGSSQWTATHSGPFDPERGRTPETDSALGHMSILPRRPPRRWWRPVTTPARYG